MARTARPTTPAAPEANMDQVNADIAAADRQNANLQVIDNTWGNHDGEIVLYQRDRVVQEIKFYLGQSALSMLEAGKRLVQMKEHEPHGEWLDCLSRVGIEQSVARRMMSAAIKFAPSNRAMSHDLIAAAGSKSKLIELLILDDSEIAELDKGGTVANLTLDDIERMSTSELRTALREARENEEANGRVLQDKNAKLDELANKLNKSKRHVKTMPPDEIAEQIRREAGDHTYNAEGVIRGAVRPAIEALYQHAEAHGGDHSAYAAGLLAQLQRAIVELRDAFNIPEHVAVDNTPEWAKGNSKKKAA